MARGLDCVVRPSRGEPRPASVVVRDNHTLHVSRTKRNWTAFFLGHVLVSEIPKIMLIESLMFCFQPWKGDNGTFEALAHEAAARALKHEG